MKRNVDGVFSGERRRSHRALIVLVAVATWAGPARTLATRSVADQATRTPATGAASVSIRGGAVQQTLARLDSADPLVRRDARADLTKLGKSALPAIRQALQDPKTSSRVRLGVIGALNSMPGIEADDLNGAPFSAILRAVRDSDPGLAAEGYRFFEKFMIAGASEVPAASTAVPRKLHVKGAKPSDGAFDFVFSVIQGSAPTTQVRLDEIGCLEDSSSGTTRWLFLVLANDQSLPIPEQRYGDDGRPHRYPTAVADRQRFTLAVPMAKSLQLRVVGYKPKHLQ